MDKATRAALEAVRDRYLDLTVGEVMQLPELAYHLVCVALAEGRPCVAVDLATAILAEVEA